MSSGRAAAMPCRSHKAARASPRPPPALLGGGRQQAGDSPLPAAERRRQRPPAKRIAVFDNDGTLWSEQEPFASALRGDIPSLLRQGPEAYQEEVKRWIRTARHPQTGRLYSAMVFQPMLELLGLLRPHGFRTSIVSGGDVAFMRVWSESVYGIPPEQMIVTRIALEWRDTPDGPQLERLPQIEALVDGLGHWRHSATATATGRCSAGPWPATGLRPALRDRPAEPGPRSGPPRRLDHGGHGPGLAGDPSTPTRAAGFHQPRRKTLELSERAP